MEEKILEIFEKSKAENNIPNDLYKKYNVKKGLRNEDGTGVLIGLTRIADVIGYHKSSDGEKVNCPGELYYRGLSIENLCKKVYKKDSNGFEETCFLILFGHLPNKEELRIFKQTLQDEYSLPDGFMTTNILRQPSINIMNKIQRSLLMLYSEDKDADNSSVENTLKEGLSIIAKMPAIMVYSYAAKAHIIENKSLIIHPIRKEYSIAQNILYLLRPDGSFTQEEAKILDLMLLLHADHGSGNNSTFTNLVVASTGTDIYSSFAASVGSLKGPKHGGANITCKHMMDEVIASIGTDASDESIEKIIRKILDKDFFDNSGLLYGMGHAVYTISDPRAEILKEHACTLAIQTGNESRFNFYKRFEAIAKNIFKEVKNQDLCSNIDFYSGLVYDMMQIPEDLYSPLFVCARCVGWLAHNIEEKLYSNRIIRPAGLYVGQIYDEEKIK